MWLLADCGDFVQYCVFRWYREIYKWVEVTTAPSLAVPTIEESLKGNNFRLRFSITDVQFLEVCKFNNPSCWDLLCPVFKLGIS